MIVDFHCHSTASDGTCAPRELVAMADDTKCVALALTDHDNCDGIDEFREASGALARRFAGIELSIEAGDGFDRFHLLALGLDTHNRELKNFLAKILAGRNARNREIIANFRRLGFAMDEPDATGKTIFDYAHGDVLARPHFAKWLLERGIVASVKEAFSRYLLEDSPRETRCYEERWHPPQEETFRIVHDAGGLCIMAHPKFWRSSWRATGEIDYASVDREWARLKEVGLDGVESLYQANTEVENFEFSRLAIRHHFLQTAGSDFHGTTKPTVSFGMSVSESFIAPLLEVLSDRNLHFLRK